MIAANHWSERNSNCMMMVLTVLTEDHFFKQKNRTGTRIIIILNVTLKNYIYEAEKDNKR
jgi:hypothetical protein